MRRALARPPMKNDPACHGQIWLSLVALGVWIWNQVTLDATVAGVSLGSAQFRQNRSEARTAGDMCRLAGPAFDSWWERFERAAGV
jgi:hypothetical protein